MMQTNIFDTMRVIADGPEAKEDEALIPSDLFNQVFAFDEAVQEILEHQDGEKTFEFIRLCIMIDTLVQHYTEIPVDDDKDGEATTSDLYELLATINDVFACSESTYGAKIMEGTVNRNPMYSGLTGRFLQVYMDLQIEGDKEGRMRRLLDILKTICKTNPSIEEIWWLDAFRYIYHRKNGTTVDSDSQELWFNEEEGQTNSDTIQLWYLKMNPQLHLLAELVSEVIQNESPGSDIYKTLEVMCDEITSIIDDIDHPVIVCERVGLEHLETPTTIEDVTILILTHVGEFSNG